MLMRTQFCVQKFKMFLKCKDSYCELFTLWVMFSKQSRIAIQRVRLQRGHYFTLETKTQEQTQSKTKKQTLQLLFLTLNCIYSEPNKFIN